MGIGIKTNIGIPLFGSAPSFSWQSYWTQQKINDNCLFFASDNTNILNKVASTQLPNQVTGSSDYLTVTGSGLNARYRTPDNNTYRTADSDNVFWKTDASESTCDGNRLIAYDFPRILVKYLDIAPYTIQWIAILKPTSVVTNKMRDAFNLSIWWDNTLSFHGVTKQDRVTGQSVWTPEATTTLRTGLVGYWKLDETFGNYADSSGNAHTGTPHNLIQNVVGKIGKAAQFAQAAWPNGSYIDCGVINGVTLYSVSLWAKRNTNKATEAYLYGVGTDLGGMTVRENGDIYFCDNSGAATKIATGVWTDKTQFHHIVVIISVIQTPYPRGSVELYFDVVSQGLTNFVYDDAPASLLIGLSGIGYANSFDGIIDEFGMWSKVLTSSEVAELNNGGTGKSYPF